MQLIVYPRLSPKSQKAMRRAWRNRARYYTSPIYRPYEYTPRRQLIARLRKELGWTERRIREQIEEERKFILKNIRYFRSVA